MMGKDVSMKFCHVTISVKDIKASIEFYRDIAGLEVNRRIAANHDTDTEIVFLGNGDTEVELISDAVQDSTEQGKGNSLGFKGITLGFLTESLGNTIALLREKRYETDGAIHSPNPKVSFFFAHDPDGYSVQFINYT